MSFCLVLYFVCLNISVDVSFEGEALSVGPQGGSQI